VESLKEVLLLASAIAIGILTANFVWLCFMTWLRYAPHVIKG
jgi:hypothetical protein